MPKDPNRSLLKLGLWFFLLLGISRFAYVAFKKPKMSLIPAKVLLLVGLGGWFILKCRIWSQTAGKE